MSDIRAIFQFVTEAVLHAWPFFLTSILLSVLVHHLKLDGLIRRAFNNRIGLSIVLAVFVGAFSPFCACTVVPIIAGLLASGVPLPPIMAFWIASPTMDPEIFALSVGILGWPMAVVRLVATLVLSLAAGFLTLALTRSTWLQSVLPNPELTHDNKSRPQVVTRPDNKAIPIATMNAVETVGPCGSVACSLPNPDSQATIFSMTLLPHLPASRIALFLGQIHLKDLGREIAQTSWKLGRWLLLAFLLEALIVLYLPQNLIATILGADNWFAVPIAALVGVPLYLTNISALPIVSGLLAQGMQPGAAIAFLIAGPVTTLPAMTAVWGIVHRRIFVLYLTTGLIGAMILGLITNMVID